MDAGKGGAGEKSQEERKKGFGNFFLESLLRSPYLNSAFPLTFVFLEISLNALVVTLPFGNKTGGSASLLDC